MSLVQIKTDNISRYQYHYHSQCPYTCQMPKCKSFLLMLSYHFLEEVVVDGNDLRGEIIEPPKVLINCHSHFELPCFFRPVFGRSLREHKHSPYPVRCHKSCKSPPKMETKDLVQKKVKKGEMVLFYHV